jgi:hypothetical protein
MKHFIYLAIASLLISQSAFAKSGCVSIGDPNLKPVLGCKLSTVDSAGKSHELPDSRCNVMYTNEDGFFFARFLGTRYFYKIDGLSSDKPEQSNLHVEVTDLGADVISHGTYAVHTGISYKEPTIAIRHYLRRATTMEGSLLECFDRPWK